MTFTERIAGAWLDAAEWADATAAELILEHDTAATIWAERAQRFEEQACLVSDVSDVSTAHA